MITTIFISLAVITNVIANLFLIRTNFLDGVKNPDFINSITYSLNQASKRMFIKNLVGLGLGLIIYLFINHTLPIVVYSYLIIYNLYNFYLLRNLKKDIIKQVKEETK